MLTALLLEAGSAGAAAAASTAAWRSDTHPEVVIAGLYNAAGELVIIGRAVPLKPTHSAQLGAVLKPSGPEHPWPDEVSSQRWGGRDAKKPLTKVQPTVVVEAAADAATQAGQVRHGIRFLRIREDLQPDDVRHLLVPLRRCDGLGRARA